MRDLRKFDIIIKISRELDIAGERDLAIDLLAQAINTFDNDSSTFKNVDKDAIEEIKCKVKNEIVKLTEKELKHKKDFFKKSGIYFFILVIALLLIIRFSYGMNDVTTKLESTNLNIENNIQNLNKSIETITNFYSSSPYYLLYSAENELRRGNFTRALKLLNKAEKFIEPQKYLEELKETGNDFASLSYDQLKKLQIEHKFDGNIFNDAIEYIAKKELKKLNIESNYDNLAIAVQEGNEKYIELLLDSGLDINHIIDGVTLLTVATKFNDISSISLLLKYGANANIIAPATNKSAIEMAQSEAAKLLLQKSVKK